MTPHTRLQPCLIYALYSVQGVCIHITHSVKMLRALRRAGDRIVRCQVLPLSAKHQAPLLAENQKQNP